MNIFQRVKLKLNSPRVAPYLFISVPAVLIFGFSIYPLFYALYISFFRYKLIPPVKKFLGFKNYTDLLTDELFISSFKHTLSYVLFYVTLSLILGLILALIVQNLPKKFQNFMKSIYFLPVITSMVPVAIIFRFLLRTAPNAPVNYYLSFLKIEPIGWLTDVFWALKSVIIMNLWKSAGFVMIIFLAGLLAIPDHYYEAGEIDGATGFQAFWYITLPMLKHTFVFLIVSSIIGGFQVFTAVLVLTGGTGPNRSTSTLGMEVYLKMFMNKEMGAAAAMGFVMFFILIIVTAVQLKYIGAEKAKISEDEK